MLMNPSIPLIFLLTLLTLRFACAQADQPVFSLFLIGDAGEYAVTDTAHNKTLQQLKAELLADQYQAHSAVIFLGDNIYPCGWAAANAKAGKVKYEQIPFVCCDIVNGETMGANQLKLASQLQGLDDYDGSVFMIPGNHDWQRGQRQGQLFVVQEKEAVDAYFNTGKLKHGGFYPKASFGPDDTLIQAASGINIRLVFLDSQWWLHAHGSAMAGFTSGCRKERRRALDHYLDVLDSLVYRARQQNEFMVIAQHHPIYTYGKHSEKLISFPAARMRSQHIGSKHYDYLRHRLDTICSKYSVDKLIFAAGHDHNLQYFRLPGYIHIVSGAGSKCTNEKKCKEYKKVKAEHNTSVLEMHGSFNTTGFFRVDYFRNGSYKTFIWSDELNKTVTPAGLTDFSYPDR